MPDGGAELAEVLGHSMVVLGELDVANARQVDQLLTDADMFDATAGHVRAHRPAAELASPERRPGPAAPRPPRPRDRAALTIRPLRRVTRRARHEAILAEVAQEEAEAAEADIAEKASTLDMPLHLRIDRELDAQLRRRAAAEHIPTSALVRRLLRQAVHEHRSAGLTVVEIEDIARRVIREELHGR